MSLEAGFRLGVYEIQGSLGVGGMGEVYRARDTNLKRDVALKVLPGGPTLNPDRLARFKREAQILASLNHPNIGAIYGFEESNGVQALVLELVDGPTLADRIAYGPVPLDEALPIARQIAEAVEAAHEQGIIHRDLKPANVKLRPDGTVKVLDFGLAKALDSGAPDVDSPTLTFEGTNIGVILGTAAYMSPEQASGSHVDKRGDVWAFGCILYEILTGTRAFVGPTGADILVAVLEREPAWEALPASTPVKVRDLLDRCLRKDRHHRLHELADARIEIDEVLQGPSQDARVDQRRLSPLKVTVGAAALVLATSIPVAMYFRAPAPALRDIRFEIPVPAMPNAFSFAVSPDGRWVVYSAREEPSKTTLWVRPLNSVDRKMLPGTDDALHPFWSPDSRFIAFGVPDGKLKRIDVSGGPTQSLTDFTTSFFRGTWNRQGTIVFGSGSRALRRISASGGEGTEVTELDKGLEELDHRWPWFLPDDRHFLYLASSRKPENQAIYIGSLDSKTRTRLMAAESMAVYVPPGFILFLREGALMARPFDASRLEFTGDAITLAQDVAFVQATGRAAFATSDEGTLLYRTSRLSAARQFLWIDRGGKVGGSIRGPLTGFLRLSPDGKRVAFTAVSDPSEGLDLWIHDVERDARTRLTSDPAVDHWPVWSPDGSRLVFDSTRGKGHSLYEMPSNGATPERLLLEPEPGFGLGALDWSLDGRLLVFSKAQIGVASETGPGDLWVLPLVGDRKPFPYLTSPFDESEASLSPDGRWLAYTSNESGAYQVLVRPFPDAAGGKWQVSADGGVHPRWRRDGRELYYYDTKGWVVAVAVRTDDRFELGKSTPLFKSLFPVPEPATPAGSAFRYDVSSDGQRFLVAAPPPSAMSTAPITVVLNWPSAVER